MSSQNENEESSVGDEDLGENYYTILNVPKDATDKEITQAYHKYGLIYHPDKHKDQENKRNAEQLFSKIKKAYDILIDPHKRAIYDSVGIKGLKQEDLQIVVRSKTPQEIREEYERLFKEKEERRLEKLTHSQGHFSMQVDTSNLFDTLTHVPSEGVPVLKKSRQPLIRMGNFEMQQNLDFPISNKDTVTISGTLNTQDKYGNGSISASIRRILSADTYLDFKGTLGANRGISMMAFKRFSQKCTGSINGLFRYKNGSIAPVFTNTVNYQLDTHLVGQLQYKTSLGLTNSYMSTALLYERENLSMNIRFQLSIKNTFLGINLSRNFMDDDFKLKTSVQYGFMGATLTYGIEKKLTQYSKIDASIIINSLAGVVLNLEVERGFQRFIVPVHLSHDVLPSAIFYGTITPVICYYLVKKMFIDPYLKDKEESEAKIKQEKLKSEMFERKRLALAAQNLMKETVSRIIEKEGSNGLIITKAIYGKIRNEDKTNTTPIIENDKIIDVSIPLQFLVKDHTLQIVNDRTKSNLEGFYDPCIGETKELFIQYQFNNEPHEAIFQDDQIVRLPKTSHKVQWWSRAFSTVRN